jgi:hypothetical protein
MKPIKAGLTCPGCGLKPDGLDKIIGEYVGDRWYCSSCKYGAKAEREHKKASAKKRGAGVTNIVEQPLIICPYCDQPRDGESYVSDMCGVCYEIRQDENITAEDTVMRNR